MTLEKVAVIGAGTMGTSIAVALAAKSVPVELLELDSNALEKGLLKIDSILEKCVQKGLSTTEANKQRSMIVPKRSVSELSRVTLVIEAVSEILSVKEHLFKQLDQHCPDNCILASNTSSLSITQLAGFTNRSDRVIGMHFFNPAHIMNLVEIIPGLTTSEETIRQTIELCRRLGKLAIRVADCSSFLVNRLLARYLNESLWLLFEGKISAEEIDQAACRLLMPIGPLALRDMNGLDIGLAVSRSNYLEYGERFKAPPFLQEMVERNMLGRKSFAGFYTYDSSGKVQGVNPDMLSILAKYRSKIKQDKPPVAAQVNDAEFDGSQLFLPMINEAFLSLQERVVAPCDLDLALKAGLRMRKGPLEFSFELGLPECLAKMEMLFDKYGERFRPAPLLKRYVWAGKSSID